MRTILAFALTTISSTLVAQEPKPVVVTENEEGIFKIPGLKSLTFSGQYRLRYENQIQYGFDDAAGTSRDFFGQRMRVRIAAELKQGLKAQIEFQDVRNFGEETSTTDRSADGFDMHQGYLAIPNLLTERSELRIGRQEYSLGEERFVGALDWLHQGRSFDGFSYRMPMSDDPRPLELRAFAFKIRQSPDQRARDSWFGGAQIGCSGESLTAEGYLLALHDQMTAAMGNETRLTLGTRWVYRSGGFEIGTEDALQFGNQNDRQIPFGDVFALHARVAYGWQEVGWRPRIMVEGNFATGDRPETARNERFNTLFPTGHKFLGAMDFAFLENVMHGAVEISVQPCATSRIALSFHTFSSDQSSDRFAGPVNTVSPGFAGGSRDMGREIDLLISGKTSYGLSMLGGYGVFFPGSGARDARGGADDLAHFVYVQAGIEF